MNISDYIEHYVLKPDVLVSEIEEACNQALELKLNVVCVPPLFVKKAKLLTEDTAIKISTVIGYPLGYSAIEAKLSEMVLAIIDGADEVKMVINTSAVKNGDWQYLAGEINTVLPVIRSKCRKITVILETGLLTENEIITACDIYGAAGVDFIQAGTGFAEDEQAIENIALIRKHLADLIQIKAGVEIKNYSFAQKLIKAGANLLCCNNSLALIEESLRQN